MAFSRTGFLALLVATSLALPMAAAADNVAKAKKLFKQAEKQFAKKSFDEALTLYQQGHTCAEVGKAYGMSSSGVSRRLRSAGHSLRTNRGAMRPSTDDAAR